MYRYRIRQWLFPFLFVAGLGTLLHFTYEASKGNSFVAVFSAVNESTWEHLKLLFFPMVFYTLHQMMKDKVQPAVIPGNLIATLIGMLFIIIVFYSYTGVIGHDIPFIDITLYYVAVALTLWLSSKLKEIYCKFRVAQAVGCTLLLIILFAVFTFYPPSLGIFQPPK